MYTRENAISAAAAAVTPPRRRSTRNNPAVTAPATMAWSLGKPGSVVGVASTRRAGSEAYGLDSFTAATIGWLTASASSMPAGAHRAAAIRAGSPALRAIHQPATSSPANTTRPYPAYSTSGPCSHGVDRAKSFTLKNNDVLASIEVRPV